MTQCSGSSARVTALQLLAQRRLTEAQLYAKLARKGYDDEAVAAAVASCKRDRLLDDDLYAALYVETKRAAVGDARLVAELVKRGIDRDAARERVAAAGEPESERIGQGRENAKAFLEEHSDVAGEIEAKIREALKMSASTNGIAKPVGTPAADD